MAQKPNIMIVEARFYPAISDELAKGAIGHLEAEGASYERFEVPGAFEIPSAIQMAIRARSFSTLTHRFDGYVALGCVIRGETSHYDYVCAESARGLQDLALRYTIAIGYGILTVENEAQAWARAKVSEKNRGGAAAKACLEMLEFKRDFNLFPR